MSKNKKPFKETKAFKILKGGLGLAKEVAIDMLPIPDLRKTFDKDGDGKVNWADVRKWSGKQYMYLAMAVGMLGVLLKFEIVNFDQIIELIKLFTNQ